MERRHFLGWSGFRENAEGASLKQGTEITKLFLIALSLYILGDGFLWSGFNSIIYPSKIEQYVLGQQVALITGATAFVGVMAGTLTCLFSGALSDSVRFRIGRRRPFILLGGVMIVGSLALLRSAAQLATFVGGYILLQISANVAIAGYFGLLPDLVPTEKTGLASGIMNLFQFVGNLLGFALTGFLVGTGNLDAAITVESVVILGVMAATVFGVREDPPLKANAPSSPGVFKSFSVVPKNLLLLTLARFFALLGTNTLTFFSLYYVSDILHAQNPAFLVAALGAAVLLVAMSSGVVAGFFSDKTGRRGLAVIGAASGFAGMLTLAFVSSVEGLIAAGCMIGASMGIFMTTTWALSSDLSPAGMGGITMSISNFAMGMSTAAAPGAAGVVLYLTQDLAWSARGYRPLFLFSAVYFLISIVVILRVKEMLGRPTPQQDLGEV